MQVISIKEQPDGSAILEVEMSEKEKELSVADEDQAEERLRVVGRLGKNLDQGEVL